MIGRRSFFILAGAAVAAPRAFAAGARPAHDRKAAKAEFARIIDMFSRGDTAAFLAYGPPEILAYATPDVDGRKPKLTRDQIAEFIADMTSQNGRRDEAPIRIDSFARMKNVTQAIVYSATLKRSVFNEAFCEIHGPCWDDRFVPQLEFWRVYFSGPRITLLEQNLVLS